MSSQDASPSKNDDKDLLVANNMMAILKKLTGDDAEARRDKVNTAAKTLEQKLKDIQQANEKPGGSADNRKGLLHGFRERSAANDAFTKEVGEVWQYLERVGFRELQHKLYTDSEIETLVKPVNGTK